MNMYCESFRMRTEIIEIFVSIHIQFEMKHKNVLKGYVRQTKKTGCEIKIDRNLKYKTHVTYFPFFSQTASVDFLRYTFVHKWS
jgi:hypothetical protein